MLTIFRAGLLLFTQPLSYIRLTQCNLKLIQSNNIPIATNIIIGQAGCIIMVRLCVSIVFMHSKNSRCLSQTRQINQYTSWFHLYNNREVKLCLVNASKIKDLLNI